ncbi:MAG: S41 family peptidase [Erysipelotrichaceae bacterium]
MGKENKVVYKLERHLWPDEIQKRKKKKRKRLFCLTSIVVVFLCGILLGTQIMPTSVIQDGSGTGSFRKLNTIFEILNQRWYYGKDITNISDKLIDYAINGMVDGGGDIHTSYMDAETANSFTSSLSGSFVGIGVQFYTIDGTFIIEKVFKDSPAEQAGIVAGDNIVTVNGESTADWTSSKLAENVKGEAGTQVSIGIQRGSELLTLDITRGAVSNSLFGYEDQGIGIIEMDSFSTTTAKELEAYLKEFKANNVDQLILDLRNNGGGYLETCIQIASFFLDANQVVLIQEDKEGKLTEYKTHAANQYKFEDIVILINEQTASASEVLTAALKEYLDITVIGVNSYGKGTVQTSIPFDDGSMLKYTIAEWLTAGNQKIDKIGIKPDIEVALDPALQTYLPAAFEEIFKQDMVSDEIAIMQVYLNFLGYEVDRKDGYFSEQTQRALESYQSDLNLEVSGTLDYDGLTSLFSSVSRAWFFNKDTLDTQMMKAYEVCNGK